MATFSFTVDGTPTNADYVRFSNPTGTYGLRRVDTLATVIANDTVWTNDSTGEYSYDLSGLSSGVVYDYWVEYAHAASGLSVQRVQRFVVGGSETELDPLEIRCVVVSADGELVTLETVPLLSNPTGSFGAVRTDTGAIVADDETEFTQSGTLYSVSIPQPESNLTYRYYVEVAYEGLAYHLQRTTSYVRSAALVMGRYTNSFRVERRFGVEDVHKFLGIDDGDETVDYALRFWSEIYAAEEEIDDYLRNTLTLPLSSVPEAVADIATVLAACRIYESRGFVDIGPDGQSANRMSPHKKWAYQTLNEIRTGQRRLSIDETIRYPRFEETELPDSEAETWLDSWDNWS